MNQARRKFLVAIVAINVCNDWKKQHFVLFKYIIYHSHKFNKLIIEIIDK